MNSDTPYLRGRSASGLGLPVSPVRSRKSKKRWVRRSARTTLVALGLLGGAIIAHAGWSFLHNDGAFGIRQIHVVGLACHDPQALRDALSDLRGRNLFALGPEEVSKRFSAFPWLKGFLCRKHLPDTLIVEVLERKELCAVATEKGLYAIDGLGMAWPAPPGMSSVTTLGPGLDPSDLRVQEIVAQVASLDLRGQVASLARGVSPPAFELVCADGWRLAVSNENLAAQWRRFQSARAWAATYAPGQKAMDLRWEGKVVLLPAAPAQGSEPAPQAPAAEGGTANG